MEQGRTGVARQVGVTDSGRDRVLDDVVACREQRGTASETEKKEEGGRTAGEEREKGNREKRTLSKLDFLGLSALRVDLLALLPCLHRRPLSAIS
jgi:hypothetical protein